MQDSKATQDRSRAVSQQIDTLLVEVNGQLAQTEALYEKIGVQSGDAARYLQSSRVSPAEREQAERELAAFRTEVENEARHAVELAKSQQSAGRVRIAPNRVRI
ncbi:MAG: hypothetical protein QG599_2795 [Pseudomonadota bacterium]|nr:hypothetical protein [Pseudomonadota bacterium]